MNIRFPDVKCRMAFRVFCFFDDISRIWFVDIRCAEDVENAINLYREARWEELFPEYVREYGLSAQDINEVWFIGINFSTQDKDGNRLDARFGPAGPYASVELNCEKLAEENALKISAIRKIIG